MAIQYGRKILFGVHPVRPITNIPPDAKKVRLRLRNNCWGKAFVKFSDRIEQWALGFDGDNWKLEVPQAVNHIK